MPPSTPKKKWDDTMNSHLFLAISYALDISFTQENKDEIVAIMNERFGYDVNWNGIRQHLQKLKRNGNGSAAGSNPATPTKPTPKKRSPKKKSDLANKKRAADAMGDGDDGDDEEAAKPAIKKLKLEKPAVTVKEEVDDEAQDGEI